MVSRSMVVGWSMVALLVEGGSVTSAGFARADELPDPTSGSAVSLPEGRMDLRLTLYRDGRAMVRERRRVFLERGREQLRIEGIPDGTLTESVVGAVSKGAPVKLLEQRFRYDTMAPSSLCEAGVGGRVVMDVSSAYTGQLRRVSGTLLTAKPTDPVVRTKEGVTFGLEPERIHFEHVPKRLASRPRLTWTLQVPSAGARTFDLSYLMQGVTWAADYVATLSRAGTTMQFEGWVTVNNRSSVKLSEAKLSVVAGQVNQVFDDELNTVYAAALDHKDGKLQAQRLGHVLLFELPEKTTLRPHEVKQIRLLKLPRVRVHKRWELMLPLAMYGATSRVEHPRVVLEASNTKKFGAGTALPAGHVRLMVPDRAGRPQLVSSSSLGDTPEGEMIRLTMGEVPNVSVELQEKSVGGLLGRMRKTFRLRVRNAGRTASTLRIDLNGRYDDVELDHGRLTRPDAATWRLQFPLGPGQTKTWIVTAHRKTDGSRGWR